MEHHTKVGFFGGLVSSLIATLGQEITSTILTASIGTFVSFIVSILLKWIYKKTKSLKKTL